MCRSVQNNTRQQKPNVQITLDNKVVCCLFSHSWGSQSLCLSSSSPDISTATCAHIVLYGKSLFMKASAKQRISMTLIMSLIMTLSLKWHRIVKRSTLYREQGFIWDATYSITQSNILYSKAREIEVSFLLGHLFLAQFVLQCLLVGVDETVLNPQLQTLGLHQLCQHELLHLSGAQREVNDTHLRQDRRVDLCGDTMEN